MPILGLNLADEARKLAQIQTALLGTPELNKAMSLLERLAGFQLKNPTAQQVSGISILVPTIVATQVASVWGYEFTTSPASAPPGWTGYVTTWVTITAVSWSGQRIGEERTDVLQGDVPNDTVNLVDSTLQFTVKNGQSYYFRAFIPYTSAATTTGARWVLDVPTGQLSGRSSYPLTATTQVLNFFSSSNIPSGAGATSLTINNVVLEGGFAATADGTVKIRFASEVAGSAITAKAGAVLKYLRTL